MAQRHARDPGKAGLPVGTIGHLTATREGSPVLALSFRCQVRCRQGPDYLKLWKEGSSFGFSPTPMR